MKRIETISEAMTRDPFTIKTKDRLCDIIDLLQNVRFDHLPVVDEMGHLRGIVSKTDLYKKAIHLSQNTSGKSFTNKTLFITKAEDIMTKAPVTVDLHQSMEYAIELLLQDEFHALPVMEDNKLVGILTTKDILTAKADKYGIY